jgi:hypothetical protein
MKERWCAGATCVAALTALALVQPAAAATATFEPVPIDIGVADPLFDLGVVDVNGDGHLDLYSTSHTAGQTVRLGDGAWGFGTDAASEMGWDPDPQWPGIEHVGPPADMSVPGLYVWRGTVSKVVVRAVVGAEVSSIDATFRLLGTAVVRGRSGGLTAATTSGADERGRPITTVRVTGTSSGELTLSQETGLWLDADVAEPHTTDAVHVGVTGAAPPGRTFSWRLRDRHGIGFADYDDDGTLDALIANGGLKGKTDTFPDVARHELLVRTGARFENVTEAASLTYGTCRGRGVEWVDVDADGDLDVFMTCEAGPPRLLVRLADGTLADRSGWLPSTVVGQVVAVWLDLNGDRIPELISPSSDGISVFHRKGNGSYRSRATVGPVADYSDASVGDVDNDGSPDVFMASSSTSRLLLGNGSTLVSRLPEARGLPTSTERGRWVDANLDGRLDLHASTGGLFTQRASGKFAETGQLTGVVGGNPVVAWFDADEDGDRDLLAAPDAPSNDEQPVRLWRNRLAAGHWLELDLVGPPGNRTAIGARVRVQRGGTVSAHVVGESDDSLHSQGHFRVYVGLGTSSVADSVTIDWPDGVSQTLNSVGDAIVSVRHPASH